MIISTQCNFPDRYNIWFQFIFGLIYRQFMTQVNNVIASNRAAHFVTHKLSQLNGLTLRRQILIQVFDSFNINFQIFVQNWLVSLPLKLQQMKKCQLFLAETRSSFENNTSFLLSSLSESLPDGGIFIIGLTTDCFLLLK